MNKLQNTSLSALRKNPFTQDHLILDTDLLYAQMVQGMKVKRIYAFKNWLPNIYMCKLSLRLIPNTVYSWN